MLICEARFPSTYLVTTWTDKFGLVLSLKQVNNEGIISSPVRLPCLICHNLVNDKNEPSTVKACIERPLKGENGHHEQIVL